MYLFNGHARNFILVNLIDSGNRANWNSLIAPWAPHSDAAISLGLTLCTAVPVYRFQNRPSLIL